MKATPGPSARNQDRRGLLTFNDRSRTGFLVHDVQEAAAAAERTKGINRRACHDQVQTRFSIDAMIDGYERVYEEIFATGAKSIA